MDRTDRLILLMLLVAFAALRLVRFLRLGLGKRHPALGIAGGWMPPSSEATAEVAPESSDSDRSSPFTIRLVDPLVTVAIWLAGNLVIWLALFEVPFLQTVPPALRGIVGIFANFYLIPFARHSGRRCRQRIEIARSQGQAH